MRISSDHFREAPLRMIARDRVPWLYRVTLLIGPPIRAFWRMRAFGADRVPRTGPTLVAANHTSFLDPWLLGAGLPRRPLRFLINDAWFHRSRLARFLFTGYGVLPVAAGDPEATIARALRALEDGAAVVIFPEGRISADGKGGRAHSGIGHVAARSGAPVVPCGLRGAFEALPRGRRVPTRSAVHLHVGEPLRFADAPVSDPSPHEAAAFSRRVMQEVDRLAEGRLGAVPAGR